MNGHIFNDLPTNDILNLFWQEKASKLAELFCKDEDDRELVHADTYGFSIHGYNESISNEGSFGSWVMVEDYRKLAERFLLAIELIQVMEENQQNE